MDTRCKIPTLQPPWHVSQDTLARRRRATANNALNQSTRPWSQGHMIGDMKYKGEKIGTCTVVHAKALVPTNRANLPPMRPATTDSFSRSKFSQGALSSRHLSRLGPEASRDVLRSRLRLTESNQVRRMALDKIHGVSGPPMKGVFGFGGGRSLYPASFRDEELIKIAGEIDHPYVNTTSSAEQSCPHDLLSGTGYEQSRAERAGIMQSEYDRQYVSRSYAEAFSAKADGIRSEQMRFVHAPGLGKAFSAGKNK